MVEPIKPSDIPVAKQNAIPDFVIEVVNDMLARRFTNGRAVIKQNEIVSELVANHGVTTDMIFRLDYLNIEEIYRAQGWKVVYDKPAYYENYDAFFEFSARKD